jgi:hypothetical protein
MTEATHNDGQQAQQLVQTSQQITIDDSKATPLYANFCRVTGTPEELIVDFGLNPNQVNTSASSITVSQRIILNF